MPHLASPPPSWIRILLVGLIVLLALWLAHALLPALVWAVVLAIAFDPVLIRLRARHPGAAWNLLVTSGIVAAIAVIVIVPLVLGLTEAAIEARQIAAWVHAAREHGVAPPPWLGTLPELGPLALRWWQAHLGTAGAAAQQLDALNTGELLSQTRLIGGNLVHRAVIFAFTLLTLFFLLRDRDRIIAQAHVAADRLLGPAGERIGLQAIRSVRGTIDGLVLVGIGEGAVMTVIYLALGTPHAFLLGALTAVAAMIPFGAALVFLIAAALLLGLGSTIGAVVVVVTGLVVVGIADHFIRPALIGGATRLPFLWVLVGIIGGAETLGLLGLFVGPATMAVIVLLWRDLVAGESAPDTHPHDIGSSPRP